MKCLPLSVAALLLVSSFAAIGISKEAADTLNSEVVFSQPLITQVTIDSELFLEVETDNCGSLYLPGEPMLPRHSKTFELPFGTKITDISCEISSIETIEVNHFVLPAPQRVILGSTMENPLYEREGEVYAMDALYPDNWFSYHLGGGLNDNNEHVTFLTIQTYPVRYNPVQQTLHTVDEIMVRISYREPTSSLLTGINAYDMVIIAPQTFSSDLQSLISHKNSYGVETYLKTTEAIYSEYSGVDKPEQIKYFIKDALETEGITYVLLVGGLNSVLWATPRDDKNQGTKDWYVPVRYTNVKDMGGTYDPGFISDLYYADIYDSEGNFSSWDSDKNGDSDGIFASWQQTFSIRRDYLDLYPDVYVGRLPCRNNFEVQIMVEKIITYETTTSGSSWFNRMIGIGGDSHSDSGTNFNEGEVACDYILNKFMSGFSPVRLYASYRNTNQAYIPSSENIQREISAGVGFLLFEGHGHPGSWNTHWPGEFTWADTPGGITAYDFMSLSNNGKYPVCVIGGCHNGQFNITLLYTVLMKPFMWTHGYAYAECFAWHLARKVDGGSIASFGNTGLGYGAVGNHSDVDGDGVDLPDTVEAAGGYQIVQFFKTYYEGHDILGEVWGGAERKFLNTYPAMEDQTDTKTVEQWPIIGDPSLKIGGYS